MSALDSLKDFIQTTAITTKDQGRIYSTTGMDLDWLVDLRPVLLNVGALSTICAEFWRRYEKEGPFQLAGMEVAAIPLLVALQISSKKRGIDVNAFIIRKERKTYGKGQNIEGVVTQDPVVLVDDLLNSGGSVARAKAVIDQAGLSLKEVFVVVDFESQAGLLWRKEHDVSVQSLFKLADFGLDNTPQPEMGVQFHYKVLWRFYEKGAFPFAVVPKSTPLLGEGALYMGTDNGHMIAVNAADGTEKWRFEAASSVNVGVDSSPVLHDGRLYFGANNGVLYCLDAGTGEEIWRNPCAERLAATPLVITEHKALAVALEYEREREKGSHALFNMETGARLWEAGSAAHENGSAVYAPATDYVIFGSASAALLAYEAKTGKLAWRHDVPRPVRYAPAVDEARGYVAAACMDGSIYVVDQQTGKRRALIETKDLCYATPLLTGGRIYAPSGDHYLYVIDADDFSIIERIDCGARVYSAPRLIDGRIVLGTNAGRILEINQDTLAIDGIARLPDAVPHAISAAPDGKTLYAATHVNELYALERHALSVQS